MSIDCKTERRNIRPSRTHLLRVRPSRGRRLAWLAAINLLVFATCFIGVEISLRLISNTKYWIHTDKVLIGSGQTEAGKKWWPDTTYTIDSTEFHLAFCTDAQGYRARPLPSVATRPYRVAFVGDSFTEGMQVPYESTFCARLETLLNEHESARPLVCENRGVSATDLLEYWHRITHDVLAGSPPDALVLCIYPGNDFQGPLPDAAFGADDRPLRDYFQKPSLGQHLITWVNLHSKFGSFLQRAIFSIRAGTPIKPAPAPKRWWTNPATAALAHDVPAVRRSRALLRAIDEECRRNGTKLCVLVVGPVATYTAPDGQSPLARILAAWGLDIPVIDVAIPAVARPDYKSLIFRIDGHLNEAGHAYVAHQAAPGLQTFLSGSKLTSRSP